MSKARQDVARPDKVREDEARQGVWRGNTRRGVARIGKAKTWVLKRHFKKSDEAQMCFDLLITKDITGEKI